MPNIKNELAMFKDATNLCMLLMRAGGEVRFVGGTLRDIIAGVPVSDVDLATNLLPSQVEEALHNNHIKSLSIGKAFGTITAIINSQKIEITTLRSDIQCDGRYAIVKFSNDWKEDALRRDFTINAMSADIEGNLYDYVGGLADLEAGIVKFIGDPEERISEDYVRILRFFRFSAYYAKQIDKPGLEACSKYADKFNNISIPRFRSEISKIFIAPKGIKMLELMQKHKILPCKYESICALKNLAKLNYQLDELIYLACLLSSFNNVEEIITNSVFSRAETYLLKLIIFTNIADFSKQSLRQLWQKYKHNFKPLILVNLARNFDQTNDKVFEDLQKIFALEIQALPIKGRDLLQIGCKPGKKIGNLLAIAEDLWYKDEFKISKDMLLKELNSQHK